MRVGVGLLVAAMGLGATAQVHEWKKDVPETRRGQINPYGSDEPALRAGAAVYAERCASCHGAQAQGRGRRPGLRTDRVQGATDGELHWLLENGELRYGMPSWSGLPDEQRWQVERYVKSLGIADGAATP